MRVDNYHNTAAFSADFFVHRGNLDVSKVLRIELEVFEALRIIVLLGPLDVGPQVVDREAVIREITIPIHQHLS